MSEEYVYFCITRDDQGIRNSWACYEWLMSPCMLDAAIVGIRYADLDAYYERTEKVSETTEILRGWFLVKPHPDITREEIAEAIKYG